MLPAVLPLAPSAPGTTTRFDSDRITVVLDSCAFDWHIDAEPGYSPSGMGGVLDHVYDRGYESLPADECEAEILPSGGVRIYLAPVYA